ncbi:MAG: YceI family protein [Acidimicrobiales bacterium]
MTDIADPKTPTTRTFDGVVIPTPGTFDVDASHSLVGFSVRHLMVSKTRGRFGSFTGVVAVAEDPLQSHVEISIDVDSIATGDDKRDGHLLSPDFFDAEQYPAITFTSTGISDHREGRFVLEGDLTVHGVTRPVVLQATLEGVSSTPWGTEAIGFSATGEVNREDFGLTWNQALETGGVLVGKTARLEIEAELNRRA